MFQHSVPFGSGLRQESSLERGAGSQVLGILYSIAFVLLCPSCSPSRPARPPKRARSLRCLVAVALVHKTAMGSASELPILLPGAREHDQLKETSANSTQGLKAWRRAYICFRTLGRAPSNTELRQAGPIKSSCILSGASLAPVWVLCRSRSSHQQQRELVRGPGLLAHCLRGAGCRVLQGERERQVKSGFWVLFWVFVFEVFLFRGLRQGPHFFFFLTLAVPGGPW